MGELKFEIIGDKERIKKALNEFIFLANKEVEKSKAVRTMNKVTGALKLPKVMYVFSYNEINDKIVFSVKSNYPLKAIFRAREKLIDNLSGFLRKKGIESEIRLL